MSLNQGSAESPEFATSDNPTIGAGGASDDHPVDITAEGSGKLVIENAAGEQTGLWEHTTNTAAAQDQLETPNQTVAGKTITLLSTGHVEFPADAGPKFSVAPSITNITATGFTVSFTTDTDCRVYATAVADGAQGNANNPAAADNVRAGNAPDGAAGIQHKFKDVTGGVADTLVFDTGFSASTAYDPYVTLDHGPDEVLAGVRERDESGTVDSKWQTPADQTYPIFEADSYQPVALNVTTSSGADTTPPVITILGDNPLAHEQGDAFTDPGATATDNVDGDVTGSIVVGGDTIDSGTTPGAYSITYDVQDAAGNDATQAVRTVNVSAMPVPGDPSGLLATAQAYNRILITWTDASSNEQGFKVERSPNGTTGWIQIATPSANVTSHTDSVGELETWYYRVRAYNAGGDSGYTNVANATTPEQPALGQTVYDSRIGAIILLSTDQDAVGIPAAVPGGQQKVAITVVADDFGGGTVLVEGTLDGITWAEVLASTSDTYIVNELPFGTTLRATLSGSTGASNVTAQFTPFDLE